MIADLLGRSDLLRGAGYIDGQWIDRDDRFDVTNPADDSVIASVAQLGRAEAVRAVDAAERALPAWRALPAKARSVILRRWHDLIFAHGDDLARLLTAEQGKPLAEAKGEIAYAASFVEWFAEEAKRANGDVIPGPTATRRLVVVKQPVGIVGAITPWNFPAAMITRKVAPALAVGCTVVLKPSELTPLTAFALAVLADEAGIPAGVFNIVAGDAPAIGEVLTGDPRVRKFTFTGSTPVGKMLAARCAGTVKRVSLELGGNAPLIIFPDADLDNAIEGAMAAKFRNTGQTCVCANRIYVHRDSYDDVAHALAERVALLRTGAGLGGATDAGPLINRAAVEKVERHVADACAGGGRVLTGGARIGDRGNFYAPTVMTDVSPGALLCREETFGPLAALVPFDSEAQVIDYANSGSAGLAAYFYTRDASRIWRMGEALDYGMVGINTGLISTEVAPFGGMKESGLGREGSHYGTAEFLDIKLLCQEIAPA